MKKIFLYGAPASLQNYSHALKQCGAQPIISREPAQAQSCCGLLLPGGADIDPILYGEENNGSRTIDRERDDAELALVHLFRNAHLPVLGICKGLQILNVALGGTLCQHLPTAATHQWTEETGDQVHPVTAAKESFLVPLYGTDFTVNSAHHQALKAIAPDFSIAAFAPDGVAEALENRTEKLYAVQWHPERMSFAHTRKDTVDGRVLFDFFLSLC